MLGGEHLARIYKNMLRIRLIEEAIAENYHEGEMRCPVHLSIGQEAIAVGVCEALNPKDKVYSTHRCHAHYLAKGGNLRRMMAELYGKKEGCTGGRGGSMHLMDDECGLMASIPIVSSSIPVAVGSALADSRQHTGKISVAFFGDASIEEGVFHESANFAQLHNLPVIFICENNLYSVYTHLRERQPDRPLTNVAIAHGMRAIQGNGNNVEEVFHITKEAHGRALAGLGPTFILLNTYRWREHCGPNYDNDIGYRSNDEFKRWEAFDPIRALRDKIHMTLSKDQEKQLLSEINIEISDAIDFARSGSLPHPSEAKLHVYA